MKRVPTVLVAAGLAAGGVAVSGIASGGPPPAPAPDPPAFTVIATGSASDRVVRPARRTDATVERAVQAARMRALPHALAGARREAVALGAAAKLRVGRAVGVRRDAAPPGYWDQDAGRFGPGRWCGRLYAGTRRVVGADGRTRRRARFRRGCHVPKDVSVRVTATFAAEP